VNFKVEQLQREAGSLQTQITAMYKVFFTWNFEPFVAFQVSHLGGIFFSQSGNKTDAAELQKKREAALAEIEKEKQVAE
jgi:hypothetical protein